MFGLLDRDINYINKALQQFDEIFPLPYFFDIIQYSLVTNEKLIEHINNEGKSIYKRL